MIDDYLRELNSRLRVGPLRRRRILAEIEQHLRDDGEDAEAIARFGPPDVVAARFNALHAGPPARFAAGLVLVNAFVVFAAVQGLEDFVPPAPWPAAADAPPPLRATFLAATAAILVAVGAAAATFVLPRLLRRAVSAASCLALLVCVGLLAAHAVLRAGYVPGSPTIAAPIALAIPLLLPALAAATFLARPELFRSLVARLDF